MTKFFQGLVRDERGISALEYAILAAIIIAIIVGALTIFGGDIKGVFTRSGSQLQGVGGPATTAPTTP